MGQEVKNHLRHALSLMLKPLVRLLIAQGVTHAEFSETAKEVYVETALRHFEKEGKINRPSMCVVIVDELPSDVIGGHILNTDHPEQLQQ